MNLRESALVRKHLVDVKQFRVIDECDISMNSACQLKVLRIDRGKGNVETVLPVHVDWHLPIGTFRIIYQFLKVEFHENVLVFAICDDCGQVSYYRLASGAYSLLPFLES